jgi:hypothetical protein
VQAVKYEEEVETPKLGLRITHQVRYPNLFELDEKRLYGLRRILYQVRRLPSLDSRNSIKGAKVTPELPRIGKGTEEGGTRA